MDKKNTVDRFFEKVDIPHGGFGCWEWTGRCHHQGYGQLRLSGQTIYAHRWLYEHVNGAILDGLFCCHTCDNPGCVNPYHLFLGTHQDNMDDMVRKGRRSTVRVCGARNGAAKMIWEKVRAIRSLYAAGSHTHRSLARTFGIAHSQVTNILTGKSWKE